MENVWRLVSVAETDTAAALTQQTAGVLRWAHRTVNVVQQIHRIERRPSLRDQNTGALMLGTDTPSGQEYVLISLEALSSRVQNPLGSLNLTGALPRLPYRVPGQLSTAVLGRSVPQDQLILVVLL